MLRPIRRAIAKLFYPEVFQKLSEAAEIIHRLNATQKVVQAPSRPAQEPLRLNHVSTIVLYAPGGDRTKIVSDALRLSAHLRLRTPKNWKSWENQHGVRNQSITLGVN